MYVEFKSATKPFEKYSLELVCFKNVEYVLVYTTDRFLLIIHTHKETDRQTKKQTYNALILNEHNDHQHVLVSINCHSYSEQPIGHTMNSYNYIFIYIYLVYDKENTEIIGFSIIITSFVYMIV